MEDLPGHELGLRIAALESAAFVNGSGSGQPQGALANVSAVVAATGSTTSFTYTDVVNLVHTVPVEYRQAGGDSLAFVGSDGILKALRLKVDTAGQPIMPSGQLPSLLGYPFLVDPNMPAPSASARSLMFGAWNFAYCVRRVDGVGLQRLVEAYSTNGQIGFRAVHRVDGRVLIADAARALQHSAT
jgi:HK97 family phage major capsid protein